MRIRRVGPEPGVAAAMAEVVVDCVDGGASVGFLGPVDPDRATAWCAAALESAARGERVVLVAEEAGGGVVGTVQVVWATPENQPHRGDLVRLQVHRRARRRGVAEALVRAAEAAALEAGRTVLVLDTASADAERVYERLGWRRVGVVPAFALWADGSPVDTTFFYKQLGGVSPPGGGPAGGGAGR